MSIDRLVLHDFTAFQDLDLEFASGVNVFVGRNATGKTHVMKVLYASLKAASQRLSPSGLDTRLREKLARVFRPDDLVVGRLGRRRKGQRSARVEMWSGKQELSRSCFGTSQKRI